MHERRPFRTVTALIRGVDVDVEPEAEPDEHRAIVAALAADALRDVPDAYTSPWWRAGVDGAPDRDGAAP